MGNKTMIASTLDRIGEKDDDEDLTVVKEQETVLARSLTDPKKFKERFGFEPVRDRQLEAARDVLKGVELLDDQKAYAHKPH